MTRNIFIHAVNVHQGGGQALLNALLQAIDGQVFLSVDERMPLPAKLKSSIHVNRVKPSVWQRLLAERWLANKAGKEDFVLCFGNLPPLFKLRALTVLFLQNRYLIEDIPLNGFPLKIRFRLLVERWWTATRLSNVDKCIVQTPAMKGLLDGKLKGKLPVQMLPFVAEPRGYKRGLAQASSRSSEFDFVYVASGEPHKNHRRLIEAWCLLAQDGLFPSLCLTLDKHRFSELCSFIDEMRQSRGVKIVNRGSLAHAEVLALFERSAAAIYPSQLESFGLPLIEARQAGLPVLASELDFVRDVLDPEEVFDPRSSTSIARAVKRFMAVGEQPLPLLDANRFLASIL